MSTQNTPNLITGMLSIHAVITRGLEVAVERSAAFAGEEKPDTAGREGLVSYLRCLLSLLVVHHETEDLLAFPLFKQSVAAPYDLMAKQHQELHELIDAAKKETEAAAADVSTPEPWKALSAIMRNIQALWHPHIAIEEQHFTLEDFAKRMPPEEHVRLSQQFMEHTQKNTGPDYLMVPFLLFNLPPEKRSFFAGEMPPVVTQELVPIVWKEKWAPMQPFLLAV
jgi:hemerythrin-like domain-containing protein